MSVTVEEVQARLRYEPSTGHIFWRDGERRGGLRAFTYTAKKGYYVSTFRKPCGLCTTLCAHRVAWALYYDEWPNGTIDHINGDKLDNRIENLRCVSSIENARNAALGANNTSGVVGVHLHKDTGKWTAQIRANDKTIALGLFKKKGDAIIARKAAEKVLGYHENHGRPKRIPAAGSRHD